MSRTVLITGVTGFLGSHLAEYWLEKNYRVVALTSSCRKENLRTGISRNVLWYHYDQGIEKPFCEHAVDAVVHTAGIYGREGESSAQLVDVNVRLGLEVFGAAMMAGVGKFINAGTSLPPATSAYALSKAQYAAWLRRLAKKTGGAAASVINLRLEQMYGPFDDESKFVTWLIKNMLRNTGSLKLTAGLQKRDFIYIADVVSAFDVLLSADFAEGFHDVDLGSGNAVPVRDVVEMVKARCCSKTELLFGEVPTRVNEPDCLQADVAVLSGLGWSCGTSLQDGLSRTVDSVMKS